MDSPLDLTNLLQPPTARLPVQQGVQTQASPEELKSLYDYSKALQGNQMPVRSWTQGMSNMVNALMGGLTAGRADALGREGQKQTGENLQLPQPGNVQPPFGSAVYDGASSTKAPRGDALSFASTGGNDDLLDRAAAATSKQESGGNYKEVGPATKYGRALGKYQIMPENVSNWSKEILGRKLSAQEFLNDPAAQDAIYRGKMSQYLTKYGPEGAGRAWLGGEGSLNHPERRDTLGTSVGSYGQNFARLLGGGSGGGISTVPPLASNDSPTGRMLAFNGQPDDLAGGGGASPAQQLMAYALKGGGPAGAAPKPPGMQVVQAPSGQYPPTPQIPTSVMPGQSTMSREQITNILNSRTADPALKALAWQMYMGTQVNPQSVPVAGGQVLISPDRKTQYYNPDLQKDTLSLGGGFNVPRYGTVTPGKLSFKQIPNAPSAPTVPVRPGVPTGPNVLPQPGGAMPFAPVPTPGPQGAAPPPSMQPAMQTAALGPNAPIPPAANPAATPPMPAPPPATAAIPPTVTNPRAPLAIPGGPQATPPVPPALPGPPPTQLAQAGPTSDAAIRSLVGDQNFDAYKQYKEYNQGLELKKSNQINQQDIANKKYGLMSSQALAAGEFLPQLKLAQQLAGDKDNPQGLLAGPQMFYNRFLDAIGQGGNDPATAGLVFQKVLSGSILDSLRAFTQGASVGQIRTMEITLAKLANANIKNTPEANQILLNIAVKAHERMIKIAGMAADYQKEHGWLDQGWDKHVYQWQVDNPLLKNEEINNFRKLTAKATSEGAQAPAAGKTSGAGSIQDAVEILKKQDTPNNRLWFEHTFGEKPDKYLVPQVPQSK